MTILANTTLTELKKAALEAACLSISGYPDGVARPEVEQEAERFLAWMRGGPCAYSAWDCGEVKYWRFRCWRGYAQPIPRHESGGPESPPAICPMCGDKIIEQHATS